MINKGITICYMGKKQSKIILYHLYFLRKHLYAYISTYIEKCLEEQVSKPNTNNFF